MFYLLFSSWLQNLSIASCPAFSLIFTGTTKAFVKYSGTPPYDHPVYKTTSLLRPYSFKPNVKSIESLYYFEDPVNATTSLLRPGFYGPTVVVSTGFHCTKIIRFLFKLCPHYSASRKISKVSEFSWNLNFGD